MQLYRKSAKILNTMNDLLLHEHHTLNKPHTNAIERNHFEFTAEQDTFIPPFSAKIAFTICHPKHSSKLKNKHTYWLNSSVEEDTLRTWSIPYGVYYHIDDPVKIKRAVVCIRNHSAEIITIRKGMNIVHEFKMAILHHAELQKLWDDDEEFEIKTSELSFVDKIQHTSTSFQKEARQYSFIFELEKPGEQFQFINTPEIMLHIKADMPASIPPPYTPKLTPEMLAAAKRWVHRHLIAKMIFPDKLTAQMFPMPDGIQVQDLPPPTRVSSPIKMVEKGKFDENGDMIWRMAVDYRRVNKLALQPIVFDSPNVEEGLRKLCGHDRFSTLDVKDAFFRQRVRPEDRYLSSFTIPTMGTFNFAGLGQGMAVSPAHFYATMKNILNGSLAENVYVQTDDIIVGTSGGEESHERVLLLVLKRLADANVKIDVKKCSFSKDSVDICGKLLSKGTVRPHPSRLNALKFEVPSWKNEKAWLSIQGVIAFFRIFIPSCSKRTAKIKNLRQEAITDSSKSDENRTRIQNELDEIEELIRAQTLVVVKPTMSLLIRTDASKYAIGIIGLDRQTKRPFAFESQALVGAQVNSWSTFEKELFSVRQVFSKFKLELLTCKSATIENDNISSVLDCTSKTASPIISARALKFIMEILSRMDAEKVKIKFLSGFKNFLADYTTRYVNVRSHIKSSDTTSSYFSLITETRARSELRAYLLKKHKFLAHAGGNRLMLYCQENGIQAPKLRELVHEVIDSCNACSKAKKVMAATVLGKMTVPKNEGEVFSFDHAHMEYSVDGYQYMIILVDCFSKFCVGIPVSSLEIREVCKEFLKLHQLVPAMKEIRCDNFFVSDELQELCDVLEISLNPYASHNPRSNISERYVQTIKTAVDKKLEETNKPPEYWSIPEILNSAIRGYNLCPHSVTKVSPFKMFYKCNPSSDCGNHDYTLTFSRNILFDKPTSIGGIYIFDHCFYSNCTSSNLSFLIQPFIFR